MLFWTPLRRVLSISNKPLRNRSPASQVRRELGLRGAKVSVAVFWGRERYVSILWRYLERNLAVNGGIVDEVRWGTHAWVAARRPVTRPFMTRLSLGTCRCC